MRRFGVERQFGRQEWRRHARRALAFMIFLSGWAAVAVAASVEERLDQINRMAEKTRTETLEKEARTEGELVWYAAMRATERAN